MSTQSAAGQKAFTHPTTNSFVSESVGDRRSQPCTTKGCAEAKPILGNESRKRSEPLEKRSFSDQSGSARFTPVDDRRTPTELVMQMLSDSLSDDSANSTLGTNPYKHLYEIHDIKDSEKNNAGEIISYTLCQPLKNTYKCGAKTKVFKGTNTVMVVSADCPSNILELLSYEELTRILTHEELFEIFNTSLQEHRNMNK